MTAYSFPILFNFPSLLFLLISLFYQSLILYVAYLFKSLCPTSLSKKVETGYVDKRWYACSIRPGTHSAMNVYTDYRNRHTEKRITWFTSG